MSICSTRVGKDLNGVEGNGRFVVLDKTDKTLLVFMEIDNTALQFRVVLDSSYPSLYPFKLPKIEDIQGDQNSSQCLQRIVENLACYGWWSPAMTLQDFLVEISTRLQNPDGVNEWYQLTKKKQFDASYNKYYQYCRDNEKLPSTKALALMKKIDKIRQQFDDLLTSESERKEEKALANQTTV